MPVKRVYYLIIYLFIIYYNTRLLKLKYFFYTKKAVIICYTMLKKKTQDAAASCVRLADKVFVCKQAEVEKVRKNLSISAPSCTMVPQAEIGKSTKTP